MTVKVGRFFWKVLEFHLSRDLFRPIISISSVINNYLNEHFAASRIVKCGFDGTGQVTRESHINVSSQASPISKCIGFVLFGGAKGKRKSLLMIDFFLLCNYQWTRFLLMKYLIEDEDFGSRRV
jgi:hypothetical protein